MNVLSLPLPPLRERRGDVLLLTHDFLEKQASVTDGRPKKLSLCALNQGNITRAAWAVKKNRRAFWELFRKHTLRADISSIKPAHER